MVFLNHLVSIPSGAIFGIAFGIAFGFSLEIMSYRKHNNLYNHYEKNIHYFKNNLTKEIHNRFAQLYLETKDEIEDLQKQVRQLQRENNELITAFHDYLEINVIHKSRANSRSYSMETNFDNVPIYHENSTEMVTTQQSWHEKNDQISAI
jgi:hypothetical protein